MDFMGWSNAAMVKRYSHVTARLRRNIADRLNTRSMKVAGASQQVISGQ